MPRTLVLLLADGSLFLLIALAMYVSRKRRRRNSWVMFLGSVLLTLALDTAAGLGLFDGSVALELVGCVLYVAPQVLVFLAIACVGDDTAQIRELCLHPNCGPSTAR